MCVDDDNILAQIEKELGALSRLMNADDSEFRTVLVNPAFRKEEQSHFANVLCAALGLHELTKNVLLLLIEKGRVALLPLIAKGLSAEIDAKLLRVRARITSAQALSEQELNDVVESLHRRSGKQVIAEVEVDEKAGMGLKAQIGGMVFDATLSTMLERLRRQLIDTPLEHKYGN